MRLLPRGRHHSLPRDCKAGCDSDGKKDEGLLINRAQPCASRPARSTTGAPHAQLRSQLWVCGCSRRSLEKPSPSEGALI